MQNYATNHYGVKYNEEVVDSGVRLHCIYIALNPDRSNLTGDFQKVVVKNRKREGKKRSEQLKNSLGLFSNWIMGFISGYSVIFGEWIRKIR